MKLKDLEVLALDCQATSNNPNTGILLEMGWVQTRAADAFDNAQITRSAEAYLIKSPAKFDIPPHILKITGIKGDELKIAITRRMAWQRLKRAAKETAKHNAQLLCHAVIHYSRYEEPFLRALHKEFSSKEKFLLQILCTHDLVKRLLPGLPRKGLRAVTGYYGGSVPFHRRSLEHVRATAFIWHNLVEILGDRCGISTVRDLTEWLAQTSPGPGSTNTREYPMDRDLRLNLSAGPGIYKMYRSNGDILYVGKARSLKSRVNSYFQKSSRHGEHIMEMLSQAKHITTEHTETALEAALRESDEIKKLSPPYNIALQGRERQVVFFSKDLRSCDKKPSQRCPIGPFSTPRFMNSWVNMIELLNNKKNKKFNSSIIEEILGSSPEYAPDEECFILGARLFKAEFIEPAKGRFSHGSLLKLGSLFWKERLDELTALELEIGQGTDEGMETTLELKGEEKAADLPAWSPEKVARTFKSIIRTGAHQARRARWFCRLSESTVTWNDKFGKGKERHVIVFERGKIHSMDKCKPLTEYLLPPGFGKSYSARQKNMDLPAFDRMKILTTEIKRLLKEKRAPEICFGPQTTLKAEQLQRILEWV